MSSGGGGGGDPVSSGSLPEWVRNEHEDLLARGKVESSSMYNPYLGQRVSGDSPWAVQGRDITQGLTSGSNPNMQAGVSGIRGLTSGTNTNMQTGVTGVRGLTSGTNAGMQEGTSGIRGLSSGTNAGMQEGVSGIRGLSSGTNTSIGTGVNATGAALNRASNLNDFDLGNYAQFGNTAANAYMSPYQQNVTDIAKQNAITDYQKANIERNSDLVSRGAFGGSRHAMIQSEADKNLGQQLSELQVKGLQDAYSNAQQQFERDRGAYQDQFRTNLGVDEQRLNTYLSGGRQLADIGQNVYGNQMAATQALYDTGRDTYANQMAANQALYGIGKDVYGNQMDANQAVYGMGRDIYDNQMGANQALYDTGRDIYDNQQQTSQDLYRMGKDAEAKDQAQLDVDYEDFLTDRDWSKNQMSWYSGLMTGAAPSFRTYTGESADNTTSASNLLGLGTTALGALGSTKGG